METWDDQNSFKQTEHYFKNFKLKLVEGIRESRFGRLKGGLLLGFKKDLDYSVEFKLYNGYPIIFLKDVKLSIVPVYLNEWVVDCEHLFNVLSDSNLYEDCVLMGDFNAWTGSSQVLENDLFSEACNVWNERKTHCSKVDKKGEKLIENFNDYNMVILNGRCRGDEEGSVTYKKNNNVSIIDFGVCSSNLVKNVQEFKVIWSDLSDHNQISLKLSFNLEKGKKGMQLQELLPKLRWRRETLNRDNSKLEQLLVNQNLSDVSLDSIKNLIQGAFGVYRARSTKEFKEKWYDGECNRTRNYSFECLNNWRKYINVNNRNEAKAQNLYAIYKTAKRDYMNLCNRKKKLYFENMSHNLLQIRNSADWWSWANNFKDTDEHVTSGLVSQESMVLHFSGLLSQVANNRISYCEPNILDNFLDAQITIEEFELAVAKLKDNKAVGEDRIPIECYKYGPDSLKNCILECFNRSFNGGETFSENKSIIVALFKKGDRNLACNYRGISLLNSSDKLLGKIMLNRLDIWVKRKNILTEFQAGFREGYSTMDNIFNFYQIVEQTWKKGRKKVYCFFVDFKAAFDGVSRTCLLYKLSQMGVSTKFCNMIKVMYQETLNSVWFDGKLTEWFESNCGVKQGCIMSPLLFSLFINDLPTYVKGGVNLAGDIINILMYADDIVLFAETPRQLQLMINRLYEYCTMWSLKVNMAKSQVMIMKKGGGRKTNEEKWFYNEEPVEVVNMYKYLGVLITPSLDLKKHFKDKISAAKFKVFTLWKSFVLNKDVSFEAKMNLFNAVSRSTVCYGSQIFGYKYSNEFNLVQRFFIKKILNIPMSAPNYLTIVECGVIPMNLFALKMHMNYIIKVLFHHKNNRLTKTLLIKAMNNDSEMWTEWKRLANIAGIEWDFNQGYNVWRSKINKIIRTLENRELNLAISLARNSYNGLFGELILSNGANYFKTNLSFNLVRFIFKARCNLLCLNDKPWRMEWQRKCSLCNMIETEDIDHFIGRCPVLKHIRFKHFMNYVLTKEVIVEYLNGKNWKLLAGYIIEAVEYRKILIEEFNF